VQAGEKPSVVFHVDEDALWKRVLANVLNFLRSEGDGVVIEVLANGDAVVGLQKESGLRPRIEPLQRRGVAFVACRNSLRGHEIEEGTLLPEVRVVPAGVVHLAQRQWAGWAYLRP